MMNSTKIELKIAERFLNTSNNFVNWLKMSGTKRSRTALVHGFSWLHLWSKQVNARAPYCEHQSSVGFAWEPKQIEHSYVVPQIVLQVYLNEETIIDHLKTTQLVVGRVLVSSTSTSPPKEAFQQTFPESKTQKGIPSAPAMPIIFFTRYTKPTRANCRKAHVQKWGSSKRFEKVFVLGYLPHFFWKWRRTKTSSTALSIP